MYGLTECIINKQTNTETDVSSKFGVYIMSLKCLLCESVKRSQTKTDFKHMIISFQPFIHNFDIITGQVITNPKIFLMVLYKLCKSYRILYHELNLYCIAP